jgi:hypothetical protein
VIVFFVEGVPVDTLFLFEGVDFFLKQPLDFANLGVPLEGFLGENQFAINRYFKNTTRKWDEFPVCDEVFYTAVRENFGCQTDNPVSEVSSRAVFDGD